MLGALLELTKIRITVASAISVITGHLMFVERLSTSIILPTLGVFLLACGSAALNQVQEARLDATMRRTARRPVPSGRIRTDWALFVVVVLVAAGFYLLSLIDTHTYTLLGLGALAVLWYNGIYTYLKRVTAFAVVPGSLIGAIPPVIGWVAGGGLITDRTIIEVGFWFFVWQIPHFWLLALIHGEEYEQAGLPTLTRIFSPAQLRRVTFMWILAVAATGLLVAVTGHVQLPWNIAILVASVWLSLKAFAFLHQDNVTACFPTFMRINVYALLIMACLSGSSLT